MEISLILFNIMLLIFLFMLIYIFLYINTNSFTKTYEKFTDEAQTPQNINSGTFGATQPSTAQGQPVNIPPVKIINDGTDFARSLKSHYNLLSENENAIKANTTAPYNNGYYWLDLPVIGPKLHYIILDTTIDDGGWILAMRGTAGSSRFVYSSSYWSSIETYNADFSKITTLDINSVSKTTTITYATATGGNTPLHSYNKSLSSMFSVSSIGDRIYDIKLSSDDYDAKFDVYNYYNCKKYMIVFYDTSNKQNKISKNNIIVGSIPVQIQNGEEIKSSLLNNIVKTALTDVSNLYPPKKDDGINLGVGNNSEPKVRLGSVYKTDKPTLTGVGSGGVLLEEIEKKAFSASKVIIEDNRTTTTGKITINATPYAFELYVK